jgi:uncharacterized cysteine cluster protein YcgN (CxxCxxCC family)
MTEPFWKTKTLEEMTPDEWEAVCDGCAKCCLVKLEDEETGDIAYTRLHCRLLDGQTCRCSNYAERKTHVPDCIRLTPKALTEIKWMPDTCAYKLLQKGQPLPPWHHLVCGDRHAIHESGHSVRGQTYNEDDVDEEDLGDWIIDWNGNPP